MDRIQETCVYCLEEIDRPQRCGFFVHFLNKILAGDFSSGQRSIRRLDVWYIENVRCIENVSGMDG